MRGDDASTVLYARPRVCSPPWRARRLPAVGLTRIMGRLLRTPELMLVLLTHQYVIRAIAQGCHAEHADEDEQGFHAEHACFQPAFAHPATLRSFTSVQSSPRAIGANSLPSNPNPRNVMIQPVPGAGTSNSPATAMATPSPTLTTAPMVQRPCSLC